MKKLYGLYQIIFMLSFCQQIQAEDMTYQPNEQVSDLEDKHTFCGRKDEECAFKRIFKKVKIDMTMTIPQLAGAVPLGGNLDVTPFAIGPNGKIYKGNTTNIVPSNAFIQPLNTVKINRPVRGNYVIGYFIKLGNGSPLFSPSTIANFSGVVLNAVVGDHTESVTIPVQTLFLASLATDQDVITVTGNFVIDRHF